MWLDPQPIYVIMRTQDGFASVSPIREIRVPNGTLTDNGNGSVSLVFDTLPDQTGQAGKFLKTDGAVVSWAAVPNPDLTPYALLIGAAFTGSVSTTGDMTANRVLIGSGLSADIIISRTYGGNGLTLTNTANDLIDITFNTSVTGANLRYENRSGQQIDSGLPELQFGTTSNVSPLRVNRDRVQVTGNNSTTKTALTIISNVASSTVPALVVRGGATPASGGHIASFQTSTVEVVYIGSAGHIRAIDGTRTTPAYSFGSDTGSGLWVNGFGNVVLSSGGTNLFQANTAAVRLSNSVQLNWANGDPTIFGTDAGFARSASGVVRVTDGSTGIGSLIVNQIRTDTITTGLTTLGTVIGKEPRYDTSGALLGYVPIYDNVT